jgi:hypothetical protein
MKTTDEDKAKVYFEELCEWRHRLHHEGALRHVAADRHSNDCLRNIEDLGYYIWKIEENSEDDEEYTYALRKDNSDANICTELDFGYNLKCDRPCW